MTSMECGLLCLGISARNPQRRPVVTLAAGRRVPTRGRRRIRGDFPANMGSMTDTDIEVDARGLLCPLPVLRLAKAFAARPAGAVARLLATDPVAVEDVEVFCREGGHELIESCSDAKVFSFRVRKLSAKKV